MPTAEDPFPSGFRVEAFHRTLEERVAGATLSWAWPGRSFRGMNDFAQLDRRVRFALVVTQLRNHIVRELNGVCRRAGLPQVTVQGLPTEEELKDLRERLRRGEKSFDLVRSSINW